MTINVSQNNESTILCTESGNALGIDNAYFDADYLVQHKLVTNTAQGRGTVYFFKLNNTQLVLRHYKRGGLVAKVNDDKFVYSGNKNTRCYKEIEVLQKLREAKVNVPEAIAGRIVKNGLFYSADIITKVIDNAIELHEVLQKNKVTSDVWQAIGREVRKMHNAQLCHYDINVKNILLVQAYETHKIHLLDFDKCEFKNGSDWKSANLERLKRSLLKQSNAYVSYHYEEINWQSLMAGYNE